MLNKTKIVWLKWQSHDFGSLFNGNLGSNAIYFLCLLFLCHVMDPAIFGVFRLSYAYITISSGIATLGINTAITRYSGGLERREKAGVYLGTLGFVLVAAGVCLTILAYQTPALRMFAAPYSPMVIIGSYLAGILGGSCAGIVLAGLLAEGWIKEYSRFLFIWKATMFIFAAIGGLWWGAEGAIIAMAISYVLPILRVKEILQRSKVELRLSKISFRGFPHILHRSLWPFLSACVSVVYANYEFLFITEQDVRNGVAGAYAMASLIFIGGLSLFSPFQTYAVSQVVTGKATKRSVIRLQVICFIITLFVVLISMMGAYFLHGINPVKFGNDFTFYSMLVCAKLALWSAYSVTGAIIYHLGGEMESFLLSSCTLGIITIIPWAIGMPASLNTMVGLQLLSGVALLIGSSFIFMRRIDRSPVTVPIQE